MTYLGNGDYGTISDLGVKYVTYIRYPYLILHISVYSTDSASNGYSSSYCFTIKLS